ncbi:hypothetical protein CSUI_002907 [Cystoisospora suis]|uniref:Uncharacterized protein n=1 Tax=Cystoisospora suis TaxID=483139 RepID=A0A2C6L6C1_9APIC|nr:hypothetical protein CSUI_002907 [Cystoisospora suis]
MTTGRGQPYGLYKVKLTDRLLRSFPVTLTAPFFAGRAKGQDPFLALTFPARPPRIQQVSIRKTWLKTAGALPVPTGLKMAQQSASRFVQGEKKRKGHRPRRVLEFVRIVRQRQNAEAAGGAVEMRMA